MGLLNWLGNFNTKPNIAPITPKPVEPIPNSLKENTDKIVELSPNIVDFLNQYCPSLLEIEYIPSYMTLVRYNKNVFVNDFLFRCMFAHIINEFVSEKKKLKATLGIHSLTAKQEFVMYQKCIPELNYPVEKMLWLRLANITSVYIELKTTDKNILTRRFLTHSNPHINKNSRVSYFEIPNVFKIVERKQNGNV